jgi:hypothetical protein
MTAQRKKSASASPTIEAPAAPQAEATPSGDADASARRGPGRPPKPADERTQAWAGIKLFVADLEALLIISRAHGGIGRSDSIRRAIHHYARTLLRRAKRAE